MNSSPRSLATRRTRCAVTAATAASTARRRADREEWAGSTLSRRATAARRRARPAWLSRCSRRSATSMRSRSAWRMSSTASASIISPDDDGAQALSRFSRCFQAGSAISAASATMRTARERAPLCGICGKHIGVPITMVSNGPAREDIIYNNWVLAGKRARCRPLS